MALEGDTVIDIRSGEKRGGVAFGEIIRRAEAGESVGQIEGQSGKILRYAVRPNSLEVSDELNPSMHMLAFVNPETHTVGFSLRTRKTNEGLKGILKPKRHPDFRAREFIAVSLGYFKRKGIEIDNFEGDWVKGSDNYDDFMKGLHTHGDLKKAAAETWSGKAFAEHGFIEIEESDITVDADSDKVSAFFHRPKSATE